MLPSALLDLLSHRLSASNSIAIFPIQLSGRVRHVQQLAAHHPRVTLDSDAISMLQGSRGASGKSTGNGTLRREVQAQIQVQALAELEARVAALKDTLSVSPKGDEVSEGGHLPEAKLQDIYTDLLSYSEVETSATRGRSNADIQIDQVSDLVRNVEKRLPIFEMAVDANAAQSGLSSRLLARMQLNHSSTKVSTSQASSSQTLVLQENGSTLRRTINRLWSVVDKLETIWRPAEGEQSLAAINIPYGMLSHTEWAALLQTCLNTNDPLASEGVLELMKRFGLTPSNEQFDAVLSFYATNGLVDEADGFFSRLAIDISRDRQRDLLVKARIKAKRLDAACALIHSFETQLTPAPMQSYTRVIQALFCQRGPGSEQHKAQAWDLFSHMRYVAHDTADEFLYTVMIRACAESADPEPERALDLFTEMTIDKNIPPTTYAYNAIILTCARSKKFALEAFRLAREMLNSHRDAYGEIPARLRPDKATFGALLEAAKRLGDLPRARWILAQMSNHVQNTREEGQSVYIDEKIMAHVFHAYASYRPPFQRDAVALVQEEDSDDQSPGIHNDGTSENRMEMADIPHRPGAPQSRQEVIKEVTTLWERIFEDQREATADHENALPPHNLVFGRVSLTAALLNAYMAVHYMHSPPSAAYKVYADLFEPLRIRRDAFTYVLALEAYAQAKRASKQELRVALSVARDVWRDWRQLEDDGVSQILSRQDSGVDARVAERAWSAMMRLLAINGHLDEAVDLLHQFVDRYPPTLVRQPSPPDPRRSTRTSLYAERPIVRFTERSTVPEDRIPPFLTFRDLNLLHHRAIAAKRPDYITYITWVAKSYEGALRRRRVDTLRPVVAPRS